MSHSYACKTPHHTLSRRKVLGGFAGLAGAVAGAPLFAPGIAHAAAEAIKAGRKQVLFIWLDGGISQLESWDPKPNTRFGGPFRPIPTSVPGTHVCELLEKTAKQMHHLTVVRSLCTQDDSHSAGVARIQRGDPKNRGVNYPFFGSACAKLLGPGDSKLPPYVWVKPMSGGFRTEDAGFLGPQYGCLALGDGKAPENLLRPASIPADVDAARNELRKKANERFTRGRRTAENDANAYAYDMAAQLMVRSDLFDEKRYSERDLDRYGRHDLGRHILQARHLIEAGVTFVKVTSFHWDTHGDNFNLHQNLVPQFDQPFAALIEDLAASGRLKDTLVIAMSEFGRTPRINGHVGRDHWPQAWSAAMAGCNLARGAVVGKTTDDGSAVADRQVDVGHLFHTWFGALGVDSHKTQYDNAGQPLPLANDEFEAIKEVLT